MCEALVAAAAADGHLLMRLDTGKESTQALVTYESMGFVRRPPYRDYPADLQFEFVCMEPSLARDPRSPDLS